MTPERRQTGLPRSGGGGEAPAWWPWGLALVVLGAGLYLWDPFPPGIWHDDGVYVLLGKALAQGEGLTYLGVVGAPPAPKFPPLFPLLLAGVWRVFPDFPENGPLLAGVNLVIMAAGAGLFAAYLQRVLRLSAPLAAGITLLAWLSPHLWRTAVIPLSEPLLLLTLVPAFWAAARMEERPSPARIAVFLLAGALAFHARSLGVAVLVGGGAALLLRRRYREGAAVLGGGAGLALPWILWSRAAGAAIRPLLQDTLGSYGGWLTGQLLEAPGAFATFFLGNLGHLVARFLALALPGVTGPLVWLGLPLVPLCVLGLLEAGRGTRTLPLTLVVGLAILALWPFQDIRLLTPFHPFLTLGTVLGLRVVLRSPRAAPWQRRTVVVLGAAWLLVAVPLSLQRLGSGWLGASYGVRSDALMQAVRAVEEKTPPDAVVGAPELWSGIHLYTGRTVVPSARFRPLAREGPVWGSPEEQYRIWMETGVTHLVVEDGGRIHGEALDRVDALCPPGTVQLLDMVPGQYLVGLAWDEACRRTLLTPR